MDPRRLIIRNNELGADLVSRGWIKVSCPPPKSHSASPGVRMGAFVHPVTGAEADPDLYESKGWSVFLSKGAAYKRSSAYLDQDFVWERMLRSAVGRWFLFLHEEPDPIIPDDFDWAHGDLSPYLRRLKAHAIFELVDDAFLFRLLLPSLPADEAA